MLVEILLSYLVGCINFAYVIGKLVGIDLSKTWDRNLGTTNLYMSLRGDNKRRILIAGISGLLDVVKGIVPALLFGPVYSAFAVLGHCFSIISYYFTKRIPTGCGIATSIGWGLVYIPHFVVFMTPLSLAYSYFLKKKRGTIRDEMGYASIQLYSMLVGLCFTFNYSVLVGAVVVGSSIMLARALRVFK